MANSLDKGVRWGKEEAVREKRAGYFSMRLVRPEPMLDERDSSLPISIEKRAKEKLHERIFGT